MCDAVTHPAHYLNHILDLDCDFVTFSTDFAISSVTCNEIVSQAFSSS